MSASKITVEDVPAEVRAVVAELLSRKCEAYLVGGCVRDLLLGIDPKDWDIATDAHPDEIMKIFPESIYENRFGTVGVKTDTEDSTLRIVEVTTFRKEGAYSDKRHPDDISFAKTVEEDLARRDFTVNAMALKIGKGKGSCTLRDPFKGEADIEDRVIRTVGDPAARFGEDALRLMRAVRIATELEFHIDHATREAIRARARDLKEIAEERVRDELVKIVMARRGSQGMVLLEELGLLEYVLPELREGLQVEQNLHHIYTVFEHSVRALDYATKEEFPLHVRLAALLHDVGKPRTKKGTGKTATFHGHEVVGARMTRKALERLKFPSEFTERVAHLVRYHMFYYNVGEVSEAGVRRFLRRVGPEYVDDFIRIREADRIGSGVPKAAPYKLRHLRFMIDKVKHDPISPKMLKVDGADIMCILSIEPGPEIGQILSILLEEVLDDPSRNTAEYLSGRVDELHKLSAKERARLAEGAKERKEEFEEGIETDMKKKHYVQ